MKVIRSRLEVAATRLGLGPRAKVSRRTTYARDTLLLCRLVTIRTRTAQRSAFEASDLPVHGDRRVDVEDYRVKDAGSACKPGPSV